MSFDFNDFMNVQHEDAASTPAPRNIIEIDGRRYTICQHACYDVDGERLHTFCGALIDVTEYDEIPTDFDCGTERNHVSTWNERGG